MDIASKRELRMRGLTQAIFSGDLSGSVKIQYFNILYILTHTYSFTKSKSVG